MPRNARCVVAGVYHHVTQRGIDRRDAFYSQQDRDVYLRLMQEESGHCGVSILGYCLMTNHVHWIARPAEEQGLARLFQRVHGRYAQYFNPVRGRTGHLWQNRFFSCALSASHLRTAARYVEWNPLRAGIAVRAEEYRWSSAAAHLRGPGAAEVIDLDWDTWRELGGADGWRQLLEELPDVREDHQLRRCSYSGMPFGASGFVEELEAQFGRRWRNAGRPKRVKTGAERCGGIEAAG